MSGRLPTQVGGWKPVREELARLSALASPTLFGIFADGHLIGEQVADKNRWPVYQRFIDRAAGNVTSNFPGYLPVYKQRTDKQPP